MPLLAPPPTLVRPPAPTVRAPANYIRPFRSAGGGGGGVSGGGGGGGGSGGGGGGGGWNGWGPEPGNPWWGDPYDSWVLRLAFTLTTGGMYVDPSVEQNAAHWEAIRDFVKAKAQDLNNLILDAPATQTRYNSGGFAFIDPTSVSGGLDGVDGLTGLAVAVGAGIGTAIAAAGVGLAQLWGYLNDRQGAERPGNWQGPTDQYVVANSVVVGQGDGSGFLAPHVVNSEFWVNPYGDVLPPDNATVSTWWQYVQPALGQNWGWTYRYAWMQGSTLRSSYVTAGYFNNPATDGRLQDQAPLMEVVWLKSETSEPLPEAEPVYPGPAPSPQVVPEPLPEPQRLPAQPTPLPLVVPAVPNADPVSPPATPPGTPTTTPATRPATRPKAPPVPGPLPVTTPKPNAQPTENGALTPQAPPPPVKTPVDAHIVNGQPVKSPGPQPTPEGIAQELGRIEEKLARLIDPKRAGTGDLTDRLGLLWDGLKIVIEAIKSQVEAGSYQLTSPCELDSDGDRVVHTVNYPGAYTSLGVISNKVDALAALLQTHKDIKQPICRQLPPAGQPVTVNFVQID